MTRISSVVLFNIIYYKDIYIVQNRFNTGQYSYFRISLTVKEYITPYKMYVSLNGTVIIIKIDVKLTKLQNI